MGRNNPFEYRRFEWLGSDNNLLDINHSHTAFLIILLLVGIQIFRRDILLNLAIFQTSQNLCFWEGESCGYKLHSKHIILPFAIERTHRKDGRIGIIQPLDTELTIALVAQLEVLEQLGVVVVHNQLRPLRLAVKSVKNTPLDCLCLLESDHRQSHRIAHHLANVETAPTLRHHQQVGMLARHAKIVGRRLDKSSQIGGQ